MCLTNVKKGTIQVQRQSVLPPGGKEQTQNHIALSHNDSGETMR